MPIQDLLWLQTNGPLADRVGASNASTDGPSPPDPWLQTNGLWADRVGAPNASTDGPSLPDPWLQQLADRVAAPTASTDVPSLPDPWLQQNGPWVDRVGAPNAFTDGPSPPDPWLQTNGPWADGVAATASTDIPQYAPPHPSPFLPDGSLTGSMVNTSNFVTDVVTDAPPDLRSVLENFVDAPLVIALPLRR